MEPVTHILTGACLSRTGLNRKAAYATLAMAVAAELPDIDTLWGLRGPVCGLEHHRGITHTFLGIPFEAAIVVAAVYGLHRWRVARAERHPRPTRRPLTAAPVNWGLLYLFSLIALLSHLLLDYTNNYGLRPFFPFNSHWYAASIVFIFDPAIFALLLAALVLPAIFRLVSSEIGARRQPFAARGWAIVALLGVVALWTLRETQHNRAVQLAMAQSIPAPGQEAEMQGQAAEAPVQDGSPAAPEPIPVYLQPLRVLANPDPLSPFRWWTVTDFGPVYQLEEVDTRSDAVIPAQDTHPKLSQLPVTPALRAAESSLLGRVYLDWSPMPFVTVSQPMEDSAAGLTVVTFRDPRFMGDIPWLHVSSRTPLTGVVQVDAQGRVVRQTMDGKVQKDR